MHTLSKCRLEAVVGLTKRRRLPALIQSALCVSQLTVMVTVFVTQWGTVSVSRNHPLPTNMNTPQWCILLSTLLGLVALFFGWRKSYRNEQTRSGRKRYKGEPLT